MKRVLFFLVLVLVLKTGTAQQESFCQEPMPFAVHLFENGKYGELIQLDELCTFDQVTPMVRDSISFILGRTYLKANNAQKAFASFGQVRQSKKIKFRGYRMGLNQLLDQKKYNNAISILDDHPVDWQTQRNFTYYTGGVYLLNRDFNRFDSLVDESMTLPVTQRKTLLSYKRRYDNTKRRSPWVAGFLSALVPGLGKVYAGKPNEALAAFVATGLYGLQTVEAYIRQGIKGPVIYITGAFTLAYYFANIWGSAIAVERKKDEKLHDIDENLRRKLYFDL